MFGVFGRICYFGCKSDVFKSSVGVLLRFNFTPALVIC